MIISKFKNMNDSAPSIFINIFLVKFLKKKQRHWSGVLPVDANSNFQNHKGNDLLNSKKNAIRSVVFAETVAFAKHHCKWCAVIRIFKFLI
jgi:hypothetical protein